MVSEKTFLSRKQFKMTQRSLHIFHQPQVSGCCIQNKSILSAGVFLLIESLLDRFNSYKLCKSRLLLISTPIVKRLHLEENVAKRNAFYWLCREALFAIVSYFRRCHYLFCFIKETFKWWCKRKANNFSWSFLLVFYLRLCCW